MLLGWMVIETAEDQNVTAVVFFSPWLLRNRKSNVSPHLPEAASGRAVDLICVSLWIAVKALVLCPHQVPLNPVGLPKIHGKVFQFENLV